MPVSFLCEMLVESGEHNLQYLASAEHKGDMFINCLDLATFETAIKRMNIRNM